MQLFTLGTRLLLAFGFIPAGIVKITGERFTALSSIQPMGQYLDALFNTGYYYTAIGVFQVLAGILVLIPRTALLGVIIYLPIILNITILSLSVRFEGSLFTSTLMTIACLYLLFWDQEKISGLLKSSNPPLFFKGTSKKFPFKILLPIFAFVVLFVLGILNVFDVMPRNSYQECLSQCNDDVNCVRFCDCIYSEKESYKDCLESYQSSTD